MKLMKAKLDCTPHVVHFMFAAADGPATQRSFPWVGRRVPKPRATPDGFRELPAGNQRHSDGPTRLPQTRHALRRAGKACFGRGAPLFLRLLT